MNGCTVTREGNRLVLATPIEMKEAVKEIHGRRWDKRRRRWHVPATTETAAEVRRRLGDLRVDRATLELMAASEEAVEARAARYAENLPPIPGVEPSPLNPEGGGWLHQRRGYWFALKQLAAALVMGMGTGKSLVTIKLLEAWNVQLVVILCPSKVRKVWPREFSKWGERDWIVDNGRFRKKRGDGWRKTVPLAERVGRMKENVERGRTEGRPVAIVVNYEAAWQGAMREFLLSLAPEVLKLDEIHKLKAPGGKWSRFAHLLSKRAERVVGGTGTIFPHSEPDIYGQYRVLDEGIFGTSYKRFLRRFFEMGGYEGREVEGFLNAEAEREFTEAWQRIAYICDEDVLDLPGAIDMPAVSCQLGAEAERAYRELAGDFITWIGESEEAVTAPNALARLLRLQQVTSGHLPVEDGEDRQMVSIGEEKKALLIDELEDIPTREPVIVYARFVEDLRRIEQAAEATGRRYAEISGRRDDGLVEDPDDPSRDATMNPDCDLLGCQIQAAAEGIDLTRSHYGFFYSLSLDMGNYLQVRKRQDRPGQEHTVRFGFLVAEGTVDELFIQALNQREDAAAVCIRAAREYGRLEAAD